MDENNDIQPAEDSNDRIPPDNELVNKKRNIMSSLFKSIILLGIIIAGSYLAWKYWGNKVSSTEIFTQYKPLVSDSLAWLNDTLENENTEDSDFYLSDTLDQEYPEDSLDQAFIPAPSDTTLEQTEYGDEPIFEIDTSSIKPLSIDLFKVNTSYDHPDDSVAIGRQQTAVMGALHQKDALYNKGLFEELLLPENPDSLFLSAFNNFANTDIISSKSVLKLLSIAGTDLLLGENGNTVQPILDILVESARVEGILILDRKGKIVSSTNKKMRNEWIQNVMPKVKFATNQLSWYEEQAQQVTTLPLFHAYGRIGSAILITGSKK